MKACACIMRQLKSIKHSMKKTEKNNYTDFVLQLPPNLRVRVQQEVSHSSSHSLSKLSQAKQYLGRPLQALQLMPSADWPVPTGAKSSLAWSLMPRVSSDLLSGRIAPRCASESPPPDANTIEWREQGGIKNSFISTDIEASSQNDHIGDIKKLITKMSCDMCRILCAYFENEILQSTVAYEQELRCAPLTWRTLGKKDVMLKCRCKWTNYTSEYILRISQVLQITAT